jgi:autotransporter-associated beta strand protein
MARQAFRFTAQDGRKQSLVRCAFVCCALGRRSSWLRAALLASVAFTTAAHAQPVDATWLEKPASGDFNTAGNWGGSAVPTGTATFNASSQQNIGFSQTTTLGGVSVTAGAGAYTFSTNRNFVTFNSAGLNAANGASISFNNAGGVLTFLGGSTAGNSVLTNGDVGMLQFLDGSSAGNARIVNGNGLRFRDFSTAANATIENRSELTFGGSSSAGNATIISDSDNPIILFGNASLAAARLNLIRGALDISALTTSGTTVGSLEGGGNVFLGNKLLSIGGNNLSTTFAGVIADGIPGTHGFIQKEGTGALTLTGTSTYTGPTEVLGGALVVDGSIASSSGVAVFAGATLAGTGTVARTFVEGGGTLVAGRNAAPFGALTVQGSLVFTAAATYLVQVSPSGAGKTNVTGVATLGGASVQAVFAPGSYVTRQSTILHADRGLDGQFGTLVKTNLSPLFAASLSYDATNVFLDLRALRPQFMPGNVNQRNVANAIGNSLDTVGGLPAEFFTATTPAGLTQLSGETAVGSQQATFDAMHQFMGVMLDPTVGGRGVAGGAYAPMPRKALAADPFGARWNVWAAGFGGTQTISGDAVLGSNKTTSNVFGSAVGADYHVSPNTVAGVALAGAGTNFRVANGGSGESDLFQAGAHLRHTQGAAFIAAALAYGWQDVTTKRTVTVEGIESLRGHFHANAFSGRLEGGFRVATQSIDLTPYAAGQFTSYRLPSYAEQVASGSGPFALAYDGKTATAARTELGVKTEKAVALSDATLLLRSRFAWAHDFDTDRSVSAVFQALPASAFVVNGARPASDSALTTLSAELAWRNGWSAGATFDSQWSDTTRSYAGKGTVRYAW